MSALTAVRVIEVTNDAGRTHLIAEDRFVTGCRIGRFVALCETPVLAASLTTEERERCSQCLRQSQCVRKVGSRDSY